MDLRKRIKARAKEADLNSQQYVRRVLADAVSKSVVFVPVDATNSAVPIAAETDRYTKGDPQ